MNVKIGSVTEYNETDFKSKLKSSRDKSAFTGQVVDKPTSLRKKSKFPKPELSYLECLDVDKFRSKLQDIRSRVCGDHILKAHTVSVQLADAQNVYMSKIQKPGKNELTRIMDFADSTELMLKPWYLKADKKAVDEAHKASCLMLMKKLGLPKEDIFSGTEAKALRKLLQTLQWKTWTPQLYFHIRFFSQRHKLHHMSEETKALVRDRWHYILKMLKTMAKIERVLASRSFDKSQVCVTYTDMVQSCIKPVYWEHDTQLSFDKDAFRVHSSVTMCSNVQTILRETPPEHRTEADIDQVVLNLQYVTDFAKVPVEIQREMARVAYYIWIGSNRVILRQGHVAQNYYYVLKGQAISKRFRNDGKTETTAVHRTGDGFGSAAIFGKCLRLVDVISQDPMHLLVIPKEAVIHHFEGSSQILSFGAINFLSNIWFMHNWPLEHLIQCPHQAMRRQFRRTEIVEADAARSTWIYVVVRGTLRVYQRLPRERRMIEFLSSSKRRSHAISRGRSMALPASELLQKSFENNRPSFRSCEDSLTPARSMSWVESFEYKLVDSLRRLDVFGLEDLRLNPKRPPPQRELLLISDDVECAMIAKNFYLQMASPQLRKNVYSRLKAKKATYAQVTSQDCLLIPLGGISKHNDVILDPVDPMLCIHC